MDFERRFGGVTRLYGEHGAAQIRAAHIVVVGVGGVGSWAAEALVRSGVGEITLIDFDQIAESNINRQLHALSSTMGQAKVLALQERFSQINPECQIHAVEEFVQIESANEPCNWPDILPSLQPSAIIDACDQVRVKAMLAAWSKHHKVPFITVGAAGGKELPHLVDIDDLSQVTHDPLLAQLRYRLRKAYGFTRQGTMKTRCVFSRESVKLPQMSCSMRGSGDGTLNCSGYGSTVAVTATFGFTAAGQILSLLAHQG